MTDTLTLADLDFLTADAGEELLTQLATEDLSDHNILKLITQLRKTHTREQVSAAISLAQARKKAVSKFGDDASKLFFSDVALQQASDARIRQYRSDGYARVLDVCCGIGADSLAFAASGADVLGLDIDPVRIAMAQLNADALGLPARFEVADVENGIATNDCDLIFFDPARRDAHGKRIYHVEHYLPPLALVRGWQSDRIMVKLSPGVHLEQLAPYGGGVEFISVNGDLKEAVLHLGGGRTGMQATLLTDDDEVHHWLRENEEPDVAIREPLGWLVEPDPAIIRAGLVRDIAAAHGGAMLDEMIAYFTMDDEPRDRWLRAWRIRDWMPFNLKKLRAYLRGHHIGTVTVKKRGSPLTPEQLIPRLKLNGEDSATLVLTRHQDRAIVLICDDIRVY